MLMEPTPIFSRNRIFVSILAALIFGAAAALFSPGAFLPGWLGISALLAVVFFCLLLTFNWAGASRTLAWMMVLTFFLRVTVGVALMHILPAYGFDTEQQNAGYVFRDAFQRDMRAWEVSQTDEPLWTSFSQEMASDQYGGLLTTSVAIYRVLSPDAHRSVLILILAAFVATLGAAFFHQAVQKRWNSRLANLATWILVLYPDAILFGSSHMREPFVIGFGAMALWAVYAWNRSRRMAIATLVLSALGMLVISSRVAIAVLAMLAVMFFLEHILPRSERTKRLGTVVLIVAALALAFMSWGWLRTSAKHDIRITEISSGWIQKVVEEVGQQYRVPFIITYGLAQPVLPASIADPTLVVWRTIGILRGLGWYALAPFILYAFFTVWKAQPAKERPLLIWLAVMSLLWILVSSARAGGDQWDNPRYRSIFLPFMSILVAWCITWAIEKRDFWLARWLAVEVIFLGFFTNWYISRYYQVWKRLPFWQNVVWIAGLSALVLGSGWLWDFYKWLRDRYRLRQP